MAELDAVDQLPQNMRRGPTIQDQNLPTAEVRGTRLRGGGLSDAGLRHCQMPGGRILDGLDILGKVQHKVSASSIGESWREGKEQEVC